MGMDVYGNKPSTKAGVYFRRSVWGWRPLASIIIDLCPNESSACKYWHTNDGDGLCKSGAEALAAALQEKIASRQVAAYVAIRDAEIARMPPVRCEICEGSGVRRDKVGIAMKQPAQQVPSDAKWKNVQHPRAGLMGWCNGCDGRGFNPPWLSCYSLDENDVKEFAEFLRGCGGFKIC